jgi:hypothetical protein
MRKKSAKPGPGRGRADLVVTDSLRSDGAVLRDAGAADRQDAGRRTDDLAGNSRLSVRRMRRLQKADIERFKIEPGLCTAGATASRSAPRPVGNRQTAASQVFAIR